VRIDPEDALQPVYTPAAEKLSMLRPRNRTTRSLQTDYQMTSYSAMAALSEHEDHASAANLEELRDEAPGPEILHRGLPAGANFGNLVHDSLENLSFQSLAKKEDNSEYIRRLCSRYGLALSPEAVQDLLFTVVSTPLAAVGQGHPVFSLAGLDERQCIMEMPFYFHMSRLQTEKVNEILAGEPTVTRLSHKGMQGYLTGFVDLICRHNGKFYIFDYKTNYLGDNLKDYSGHRLQKAMASHNYGLQYWIYTLILHRHLQNVLPGYSFESHFGGVRYLFVRGMAPDAPGSGVFATLPSHLLLEELDNALGGEI
jgi:exodeoxyribonuclease V beta subunit